MKRLIATLLFAALFCGCRALVTDRGAKGDINKIPGKKTARLIHQSPAPIPAFVVPTNPLSITSIRESEGGITVSWNGGESIVNGSLYPNGPWSAITRSHSPAEVPLPAPLENYGSNRFYRVSQSGIVMDQYFMGGVSLTPPVGDNDVAIAATDNDYWNQDYLFALTNGTFTGFPLIASGITPCAPLRMAIDTSTWQLFTIESQCYNGWAGGPYKLWMWQLVGSDGLFTDAEPIGSEVIGGDFLRSTWGDMIRLKSGGIVACWKDVDASRNYCFAYRNPAGQWQPIICRPEVAQRSSTMHLGQHPDGSVYCFIVRDGLWPIPAVIFKEVGDQLVWVSTQQDRFYQEGEWAKVSTDADPANNRLIATRSVDPHIFFRRGEAWLTVKGACIRSAYWYGETNVVESPTFPASVTNTSGGNPDGPKSPANHQEVFIFSEPVNDHATVLVGGKLWLIKQEFNPNEEKFNLVYAQPLENNVWGERHYLYRAQDCENCRGLARNWLTSYRNSAVNPTRILFMNANEDGEAELYELTQ